MNQRWTILLGRIGAVLVAAGLTLVMVSFIPPVKDQGYSYFERGVVVQPQTFSVSNSYFLSTPVDPQHGLHIGVYTDRTVSIYLLDVGRDHVEEWVEERLPDSQQLSSLNASIMEEFLTSHQSNVAWQGNTTNGNAEFEYVPTKITNTTLVFSNVDLQDASIDYDIQLLRFIVSSERASNPAKFAIPLGITLAVPRLSSMIRRRKSTVPAR